MPKGPKEKKTVEDVGDVLMLPFAEAGFSVVDLPSRGSRAQWDRLLLPCIGPEVLRLKVTDARKAVPWWK